MTIPPEISDGPPEWWNAWWSARQPGEHMRERRPARFLVRVIDNPAALRPRPVRYRFSVLVLLPMLIAAGLFLLILFRTGVL